MQIDLSDSRVLVTGASRGIGRAIARSMAEAGARVAVHYRRQQKKAETLVDAVGGGAQAFQADFSDVEAVDRLFDDVLDAFGQLDVLVNNAGVAQAIPMDASLQDWLRGWERTMAVNLRAPAWLSRRAARYFAEEGGGRIISVASRAAFRGDTAEYMAYAATKGGLVAHTRSIARAFGKRNVKAFVLAPGFTKTDMAQDFIDRYGDDYATYDLALNDLTEPEDVAPLAVFLASGLADHATGTSIDVNAGSYVH